eukprot:gene8334-9014_t
MISIPFSETYIPVSCEGSPSISITSQQIQDVQGDDRSYSICSASQHHRISISHSVTVNQLYERERSHLEAMKDFEITPLVTTDKRFQERASEFSSQMFSILLPKTTGLTLTDEGARKWKSINSSTNHEAEQTSKMAYFTSIAASLSNMIYNFNNREEATVCFNKFAQDHHWFRPLQFELSDYSLTASGPFFAIVEFETIKVVVVRGSSSQQDWIHGNLDAEPYTLDELTGLHKGYCRFAKDIPARLLHFWNGDYFHANAMEKKPTIFCGHSLGGAVAELSALTLLIAKANVFVITFGSPSIAQSNQGWINQLDKRRILRYYFSDDPVPPALGVIYSTFETLVLIPNNVQESYHVTPTLQSVYTFENFYPILSTHSLASGLELHSMNRYTLNIFPQITEIQQPTLFVPSKGIQLKQDHLFTPKLDVGLRAISQEMDSKFIITITGEGEFAAVVRGSLGFKRARIASDEQSTIFEDEYFAPISCEYAIITEETEESSIRKCQFTCKFDCTSVAIPQSSAILRAQANTESSDFNFLICNGFEQVQCSIPKIDGHKHVAILGITGSGKSHLIEALTHHFDNKTLVAFPVGHVIARDEAAKAFTHKGIHVYELPGLSSANPQFFHKVHCLFEKENFPPSLIVVTFKKGMKDAGGLIDTIDRIRDKNPGMKFLLVLTNSPPASWRNEEIQQLITQTLKLPPATPWIQVNSADEEIEVDGNLRVIKQQNVGECWVRIQEIVKISTPANGVPVATFFERISGAMKYVSIAGVFYVVFAVTWVLVTKTPPPPPPL